MDNGGFSSQMGGARKTKCHRQQKFPAIAAKRIKAVHHADFLSLLSRAKHKRLRDKLLTLGSKQQIDAVIECIDNVNRHNVPIPKHKVQQLKRHRKIVQKLLKPRVSLHNKRKLLSQSGGFLGALIPLATSVLGGLFGNIFKK